MKRDIIKHLQLINQPRGKEKTVQSKDGSLFKCKTLPPSSARAGVCLGHGPLRTAATFGTLHSLQPLTAG